MRAFSAPQDQGSSGLLRRSSRATSYRQSQQMQSDALESTLWGTKKGQAWHTHSAQIAAAEALVVDIQSETVLRCYAFWRCLESWAALRFSDHRGLSPAACRVTEGAFKAVLTRTKTTGADKKIQSRVLHVALRLDLSWLESVGRGSSVGTRLFPPSSNEIPDSLGKVRVQICRSDRPPKFLERDSF